MVVNKTWHDRDIYHYYPVNIDFCSQFNDFLKELGTL